MLTVYASCAKLLLLIPLVTQRHLDRIVLVATLRLTVIATVTTKLFALNKARMTDVRDIQHIRHRRCRHFYRVERASMAPEVSSFILSGCQAANHDNEPRESGLRCIAREVSSLKKVLEDLRCSRLTLHVKPLRARVQQVQRNSWSEGALRRR